MVPAYSGGSRNVTHYLDEFLFLGRGDSGGCWSLLSHFIGLTNEFRIPLKQKRPESLSTILTFPGMEMDTNLGISRFPAGKLIDFMD